MFEELDKNSCKNKDISRFFYKLQDSKSENVIEHFSVNLIEKEKN